LIFQVEIKILWVKEKVFTGIEYLYYIKSLIKWKWWKWN